MRRVLEFISLLDENVYQEIDTGTDPKSGQHFPGRGRVVDFLATKVKQEVNGETKSMKAFALKAPPTVFDPVFDDANLKDGGGDWHKPPDSWLKQREANIARGKARQAAFGEVARDVVAKNISEGIKELAKQAVSDPSKGVRK